VSVLGVRIRTLWEEKEVSQIELAKAINLGNTTISQWEAVRGHQIHNHCSN
jgi:transcriptional regulator with XRE-family HTH domain